MWDVQQIQPCKPSCDFIFFLWLILLEELGYEERNLESKRESFLGKAKVLYLEVSC